MCCFAQPVLSVSGTQLFARLSSQGRQWLVYQMEYESAVPNAMILPLPVALPSKEDSVRFVSLEKYEDFFIDLDRAFPEPTPPPAWFAGDSVSAAAPGRTLEVHQVGDYVASFVPTVNDFSRLDPQFVIPKSTWELIPGYTDYGFAVFQLKALKAKAHPMAFEFATRWPNRLFFPTVHIHDGEVHELEEFDHTLYLQHSGFDRVVGPYDRPWTKDATTGMVRSKSRAGDWCRTPLTSGIVEPDLLLHRLEMRGRLKNEDFIQNVSAERTGAWRQPRSLLDWWPALPALAGAAGIGWLIRRRAKLMSSAGPDE
jgi:hypothetical protein